MVVPWSRLSVRQRLTVTVAAAVTTTLVVVGSTVYVVEAGRIDRSIDVSISQEVSEFRALQAAGDPTTGEPFRDAARLTTLFLQQNLPDANESLYAFGPTGGPSFQGDGPDPLRRSPELRTVVDDLRGTGGTRTVDVQGREYRVAVQPIDGPEGVSALVVAQDVTSALDELRDLMVTYLLLAALSVLIVAAAASWIAGRLLRPLRLLRDTARGITDGDLGGRIAVTGNDDLADLQLTFNDMLDRLESAFVTQRALLDDAGHELRTPLTVLRGHLEVLDSGDSADVDSTRALLIDEVDRMSRLVNDLLMLAKARRPDFVTPVPTDVATLTQGVLDRARGLADRRWVLDESADVEVPLDGQRITQALLQLCDNAVRFTEVHDEIAVGSRVAGDELQLWVRDTGPGVDPATREVVFERFSRGPAAGAAPPEHEGFGLGLSIVRAIASAHGGEVTLDPTTGGATFRIHVPTHPTRAGVR